MKTKYVDLLKSCPLPLKATQNEVRKGMITIAHCTGRKEQLVSQAKDDADLLAHSANVLPKAYEALKMVQAFLDDLSKSNPGYMSKLVLQDYSQWNEAIIALPKAIAEIENVKV